MTPLPDSDSACASHDGIMMHHDALLKFRLGAFFICRYIEGLRTSRDPLASDKLSFPRVLAWMIDTIKGLHRMHHGDKHTLLHRDVKPKNFLVFARQASGVSVVDDGADAVGAGACAGGSGVAARAGSMAGGVTVIDSLSEEPLGPDVDPYVRIKLGDLGLAKEVTETLNPGLESAAYTGTPMTTAPEATGGKYGAFGDVFSWGVSMCMIACFAMLGAPMPRSANRDDFQINGLRLIQDKSATVAAIVKAAANLKFSKRPCSTEVRDVLMQETGTWPPLGTSARFSFQKQVQVGWIRRG